MLHTDINQLPSRQTPHKPITSPTDHELTAMLHVSCSSHHTPYKTQYHLLIGQEASKRVVVIMTRYYLVSMTQQYAHLYGHNYVGSILYKLMVVCESFGKFHS